MIARSGYMHAVPMSPVKVVGRFGPIGPSGDGHAAWRIMEGSGTDWKRDIVAYAYPRTQGTDRTAAGAARRLSVLQRGGRHDLRRQSARPARSRAQLPRRP